MRALRYSTLVAMLGAFATAAASDSAASPFGAAAAGSCTPVAASCTAVAASCTPVAASCTAPLSEATAAQQDEAPTGRQRPPLEYRLDEFSVTLSRGACDGDCPVYTVGIHGSGLVAYYGESNVATAGQRLGRIPPEEAAELLDAVYAAGVTELRSRYLSRLVPAVTEGGTVILTYRGSTGSPRSVLTLTIRDFEKRIVFQPEYAPRELVELAQLIDELAGSRDWTGR